MFIYLSIIILICVLIYLYRKNKSLNFGTFTQYDLSKINNKPNNIKSYICVIRHGTRYPTKKMYKLLDKDVQQYIDKNDIGKLTNVGYDEMILFGKYLKQNYPYIFNHPEKYNIYSTTFERAKQSAHGCLTGLKTQNIKSIQYSDEIDAFLKVKNFFIKNPINSVNSTCLYSKLLNVPYNKCNNSINTSYEYDKDRLTYHSALKNGDKGKPFYNVLQKLIRRCQENNNSNGFIFFAHDSTLMPLYYLFKLLPNEIDYKNSDWLPFSARLEIFIDNTNNVYFYVNGNFKKQL
jgi:hypothetical protein